MKEEAKFDRKQAALGLGYSPDEIEKFEKLRAHLIYWNEHIRRNPSRVFEMPDVSEEELVSFKKYAYNLEPKFDRKQAALDLGYSPDEIEKFEKLRAHLIYWNELIRRNPSRVFEMPDVSEDELLPFKKYANNLVDAQTKFMCMHDGSFQMK